MVEIREMDDSYIFDTCPLSEPLAPSMDIRETSEGSRGRSREIRRTFFREVRERYGNCVLFAWEHGKIVGFLMFFPKKVARRVGIKIIPEDGSRSGRTLVFGCMQTAEGYRGKGVGTKLVVAEMLGKYDTVGIDLLGVLANDIISVGSTPVAMVDYIGIEAPDPDLLANVGKGIYLHYSGAECLGFDNMSVIGNTIKNLGIDDSAAIQTSASNSK